MPGSDELVKISKIFNKRDELKILIKNKFNCFPRCKTCGKQLNKFKNFCCAKCAALNDDTIKKLKSTNIKRYGVENPAQSKEIYNKIKQTNIKRYNTASHLSSYAIRNKIKNTNKLKFGCDYFMQTEEFKKIKTNF